MKKETVKIALRVLLIMHCAFAVWKQTWLGWRHMAYSNYIEGMKQTEFSTVLVPRYTAKEADVIAELLERAEGYWDDISLQNPSIGKIKETVE